MLIITLLKGVPARTTQVVTAGGVLRREQMDIVINPHDHKAVEAADYVKRRVGGKIVALTMGPESKLVPIMEELYEAQVEGVDENVVVSDRRMAGADTLATAYAVSMGIKRVLELHEVALGKLIQLVETNASPEALVARARELYAANRLPNSVYSELPAIRDTIVGQLQRGVLSRAEARIMLVRLREELSRFLVVAGIKTTDGETGSVGPQVAEALSEQLGRRIPHITYVYDFDVDPERSIVVAERRIGRLIQLLEAPLPALLTIAPEYRPRVAPAAMKKAVRDRNFRGKIREPVRWNADVIGAEPKRLGLLGSPTLVGPGVDIGKPPTQKFLGRTLVFRQQYSPIPHDGASFGPFQVGDIADPLPASLRTQLMQKGVVGPFTYDLMVQELFGDRRG